MIKNYFLTAWRNISRNKLYTTINVLGLALGISACFVIYLITHFELSFDKFHPDGDRIYRVVTSITDDHGSKNKMASMIAPMPSAMRNELTGFEDVVLFNNLTSKVIIPVAKDKSRIFEEAEEISPIIIAEPQYFKVFKYQWIVGDPKTALNEPFKVVLTQNAVLKYFGNIEPHEAIGKEVRYKDIRTTVSGVVKDFDQNSDFNFTDFISFATVNASSLKGDVDMQNWGMWDYNTQGYVKLAKGVTVAQIEKQFPQFAKAHFKLPPNFKTSVSLQPLSDVHFNNDYSDSYTRKAHLPTLYALMGIAAFILIIAAINFINLSTAQSIRRAKEVGVRKTLGSSKANLTIQFLIETFTVTIAAVILSLIITNPILYSFRNIIPQGVKLEFAPLTVLFLALITIVTALLAGLYPARVLSSFIPALSLKGQGAQNINRKSSLRKALIIFQFTVSLVFIIGTLVVADQIHYILNKDLGFNKDAIITTHVGWTGKAEDVGVLANKMQQISGVEMVTRHRNTPTAFGHPMTFIKYQGDEGELKPDASFETGDNNYIKLFGLKLIAGRNLLPSDTIKEFLVNEKCIKALGFKTPQDALGKIVSVGINDAKGPIVGVLKDFHSESLHEQIKPFFIVTQKKRELTLSAKLAATNIADVKQIIGKIEKASKEVYPNEKFEYKFLDETIAKLYEKERKTSQLMNSAMLVAIFISCMGLFGLATFTAQQRVKEIGIRKVLGANPLSIVSMLSRDFLSLVVLALIIASPVAYYLMHQWLQGFAYRVDISWWIFAVSGLSAVIIALITISFQSIKAALTNPITSLRSE